MLDELNRAEMYPERDFVLNPVTSTLANLGWTMWLLGFPDQAKKYSMEAIDVARQIDQPFSFAMAVVWAGQTQHALGCSAAWGRVLEEAEALINNFDIQAWAPRVAFLQGKYQTQHGNSEQGITLMRGALSIIEKRQSKLAWTWMCAEMAAEMMHLDQVTESEQLLVSGLEHGEVHGERFWLPELCRLTGILHHRFKAKDPVVARVWLNKAIKIADANGDRSCKLRALISLNQMPSASDEDVSRLKKLVAEFQEGIDTYDLRQARDLLKTPTLLPN